jgi:hypothetical protein
MRVVQLQHGSFRKPSFVRLVYRRLTIREGGNEVLALLRGGVMPRLNTARPGQRVQVKGRQIEFSFWPSRPGRLHYSLQSRLFVLDP